VSEPKTPIILFDGVCNLCHAAVQWVIDHDPKQIFRFASLQSQAAQSLLVELGPLPDSIVLVDEAGVHTRSQAAMRIARRLGLPWSLAAVGAIFPAFVRDGVYRWIARNRYSWFGRRESCRVPSPELAARFLDAEEVITIPAPAPLASASASFWQRSFYVYFILYCFSSVPLWHRVIPALSLKLLGIPITIFPNGSGDTTFNYVQTLFHCVAALGVALLWRWPLPRWFGAAMHIALRYYLATTLAGYGWAKLVPLQFGSPGPAHLLRSFADASPMGLVWTMIGASTPYQMFTGFMELLAALLLFFPATSLLGAFLSAAIMLQIAALNYCYDIPVKLFSTHLLWFSCALLTRDAPRLLAILVLRIPTEPIPVVELKVPGKWWPRLLSVAKAILVINVLIVNGYYNYHGWLSQQSAILRSPFHGFYSVEEFQAGTGQPRWVRIGITGNYQLTALVESGEATRFALQHDASGAELSLTERGNAMSITTKYSQPKPELLLLEAPGFRVLLKKQPPSSSLLLSRGFHWINEVPFNR
jgi:predicted DCC family thiol-disulfide oxidoreductase YuxK